MHDLVTQREMADGVQARYVHGGAFLQQGGRAGQLISANGQIAWGNVLHGRVCDKQIGASAGDSNGHNQAAGTCQVLKAGTCQAECFADSVGDRGEAEFHWVLPFVGG